MAGINFDFTGGVLPGAITFTRASTGTYNSSGNILTTASSNVARFNYVSGVSCLLVEPSATNLILQSNNFSNAAAWTLVNSCVVTAAQFVSPDGTNDGWSFTSGTGNASIYQIVTYAAVPYVMSAWLKTITGGNHFDFLVAGTSVIVLQATSTLTRFSSTRTAGAGDNGTLVRINEVSGTTFGIYGVQLELGAVPTSYVPTTTTAATRAADSAVFTIPAGVSSLTYTFDDSSTQVVSVAAGSYTIPTNLNRRNIKTIVGIAVTQQPMVMIL